MYWRYASQVGGLLHHPITIGIIVLNATKSAILWRADNISIETQKMNFYNILFVFLRIFVLVQTAIYIDN